MARIYGLNGFLRGKQGNNVFSISNGTQVVKAYQPVVANPRTQGQREQRAKFALAGKMSGATPASAIQGLGMGSARRNRADFVSQILRNATVNGSIDNLVATIQYADILYSRGNVPMCSAVPAITAAFASASQISIINVVWPTFSFASAPDGYGELMISALYDAETSMLEEVQCEVRPLGRSKTLAFRQGRQRDAFIVNYVVPFARNLSAATPRSGNLGGTDTNVNLRVSSANIVSNAKWGQSVFISVIPLTASQSLAPSPADDDTRNKKK